MIKDKLLKSIRVHVSKSDIFQMVSTYFEIQIQAISFGMAIFKIISN